jgi:hypothetical protein
MLFHLIFWPSLLAYVLGAAYSCRATITYSYENRHQHNDYSKPLYKMLQDHDRLMVYMVFVLIFFVWPLYLLVLLGVGSITQWMLKPVEQDKARKEQRQKDIRFWKDVSRDNSVSETERETAQMILSHLDPDRYVAPHRESKTFELGTPLWEQLQEMHGRIK